jgi:acetyl-CoA carboxylase carboxyltransferase component
MFLSGALTINASRKEARFIRFCDAFNIPIIMLVDTTAYAPGTFQERGGIIHHGAKVLYALAEATVPRVTLVLRKVYGGGSLGMGVECGLGTDLIYAWPMMETGIMGPKETVALFHGEEIKNSDNPEETSKRLVELYENKYGNPFGGASIGRWNIENLIEPRETRKELIKALKMLSSKNLPARYPKKHGNIPL